MIKLGEISNSQIEELSQESVLDMIAYFQLLKQEMIIQLHDNAELEPDQIIELLEKIG